MKKISKPIFLLSCLVILSPIDAAHAWDIFNLWGNNPAATPPATPAPTALEIATGQKTVDGQVIPLGMPADCPLKEFERAANDHKIATNYTEYGNRSAINRTKTACSGQGLSDSNTAENLKAYHLTWGDKGEFTTDIIPLDFKRDESVTDRFAGTLSYYRAGGHAPGVQHLYPNDNRVCVADANVEGTKYVCPRQRPYHCDGNQLFVTAPDGKVWPVQVRRTQPAEFVDVFAKNNLAPSVGAGLSASCYVVGQIPPFGWVPWMRDSLEAYGPSIPSRANVTPAAPATPGAPSAATPATE